MRRRKRAARPGEGPTVRQGQLKRFLLFAVEPGELFGRRGTAVIGPKKLPGASGDTPEALEKGKRTMRTVGRGASRRRQSVRYEARPSTVPALAQKQNDLPNFWRDAIR